MVRLLVIILVVLGIDIVGGLLVGVKVIIPMLYPTEVTAPKPEKISESSASAMTAPVQHALDPININPRNSNGDIFSIEIVFEANDQKVIDELTLRNYEIRDKLSSYLAFKTIPELNDQVNWDKYKTDMMQIVNDSITSGDIMALYIPSKILQFQ
jgi:flagellar basal body-associated protein FliL